MRGVKDCFVRGKENRANAKHSREEVTKAINLPKTNHLYDVLSVGDLAAVVHTANMSKAEEV